MAVIGVALLVQAVAGHAGAISPRLLLGVLFIAAGCGSLVRGDAAAARGRMSAEPGRGTPSWRRARA